MTDETAELPKEPLAAPPVETAYDPMGGRNPVWGNAEHSVLNVEVDFRGFGWQPFATMVADFPTDPNMAHMQTVAEAALAGDYGPIAEYVPPTLDYLREVATPLDRMTFRNNMAAIGVTTTVINDYITSITDPAIKEERLIFWQDSQAFRRLDPFVTELGAYAGKTPEELDAVFGVVAP